MSEYVIGYLLFHERRLLERLQAQREHRWDRSTSGMLRGKTLGLLGVGSLGAHLAGTAKRFRMTVHGYTRASEDCPDVDVYYHGSDLLEFAGNLDYLVSVLPNTSATRHIVDASLLGALPSHALFINIGRGSALDEPALVEALANGKIAGAVLDVFVREPLPPEHPFWDLPNLLMTFHTSAPSLSEDISEPTVIPGITRVVAVPDAATNQAIFATPAPVAGKTSAGKLVQPDGRVAVFTVDKVTPGDLTKVPLAQRDAIGQQICRIYVENEIDELVKALRKRMNVTVVEQNL